MLDPESLEQYYYAYVQDLKCYAPEGIIQVDLALLQELDLLTDIPEEEDSDLTHNFYVVESDDKLTLFNQKFSVWIVPQLIENQAQTLTFIASNKKTDPQLQMVFSTSGAYNHSSLVLKILEKFLEQIEENENEVLKFKNSD